MSGLLVREFIPVSYTHLDIVFRHRHIGSRRVIDDIRVNTDVQHFPLTDIPVSYTHLNGLNCWKICGKILTVESIEL